MALQLEATLQGVAERLGLSRPSSGLMQRLTMIGNVDGFPVEFRLATAGTERSPPYEPSGVTGSTLPLPDRREPKWVWQARVTVAGLPKGLKVRPMKGILLKPRWREVGCRDIDLAVRAADMTALDPYLTEERIGALCGVSPDITVARNRITAAAEAANIATTVDSLVAMVHDLIATARVLSAP